jgi:hypothetical protein
MPEDSDSNIEMFGGKEADYYYAGIDDIGDK